jgi:hypothetical protein
MNAHIQRNQGGSNSTVRARLHDEIRDCFQQKCPESSATFVGRQSGSLEWRQRRHELGPDVTEMTPSENELIKSKKQSTPLLQHYLSWL